MTTTLTLHWLIFPLVSRATKDIGLEPTGRVPLTALPDDCIKETMPQLSDTVGRYDVLLKHWPARLLNV